MEFGFFAHDVIRRRSGIHGREGLSKGLERTLLGEAAGQVRKWIGEIGLGDRLPEAAPDIDALARHLEEAAALDLFSPGGVPRRNFVALALINFYLQPKVYLESGYWRGCSIFAAMFNPALQRVVGFDPEPHRYKVTNAPPNVEVDLR
ncbi:MAG: hypothetical protein ACO1OD_04210 [Croceibacterium sp.]